MSFSANELQDLLVRGCSCSFLGTDMPRPYCTEEDSVQVYKRPDGIVFRIYPEDAPFSQTVVDKMIEALGLDLKPYVISQKNTETQL